MSPSGEQGMAENEPPSMRIAVLGAGGIGGYYGALLAKAGHDVAFIARGAHLEAIQRRGVTVRTSEGEFTIPVTASADTTGVGAVDLVLFSVKSYDTETATQALTPLMARDTTVITFQNGLDNVEAIASVAGAVVEGQARGARVLGGGHELVPRLPGRGQVPLVLAEEPVPRQGRAAAHRGQEARPGQVRRIRDLHRVEDRGQEVQGARQDVRTASAGRAGNENVGHGR